MKMKEKARIATLMSDKIESKTKVAIRDKEVHYIMLKEIMQQEDIHPCMHP